MVQPLVLSVVSDRPCLAQGWDQSCALAGLGRLGQLQWVLLLQGHPAVVVVVASDHLCSEPVWPVPRCGPELWAASQHRDT